MTTELHLTWDDDTIETVLSALHEFIARYSASPERTRAKQARDDIEAAEIRTARTGMPEFQANREGGEILREQREGYIQVWHCAPPAPGTRYKVYPGSDEWETVNEMPVRHIYQIEITEVPS